MNYTVICGGNPYTVVADTMVKDGNIVRFEDDDIRIEKQGSKGYFAESSVTLVAEFDGSKIDGIIMEDNNLGAEQA